MRYFQFNTQLKDELDEKMLEIQMEQMREKRDEQKEDDNLMARLDHALSFPQRFKQAGDWK
jgi:hypothetical protein